MSVLPGLGDDFDDYCTRSMALIQSMLKTNVSGGTTV